MAVLIFGILRGVCLAGSVVDVRSVVGFASAGGAGQVWWVVSGGAVGRSAGALARRAEGQLTAGHKKERVRSPLQSHPLNLKWRLPTLPLSQYHRHNWA